SQTFFDQEAANRRKSLLLMASVIVLLAVFGFVIGFAFTGSSAGSIVVTVGAVVVGGAMALGSYYGGDKLVLTASRARAVTSEEAPQLYNVVEELAVAGNIPVPRVYIIDDSAPNAFATGRDPTHASVAITT